MTHLGRDLYVLQQHPLAQRKRCGLASQIDKRICADPSSHRVSVSGNLVDLGPTEFRLLHFFMTHKDKVYSRSRLLDKVWGTNVFIEERTVDVHIRRLRKALEPHGVDGMVQTVRGAGYRFADLAAA